MAASYAVLFAVYQFNITYLNMALMLLFMILMFYFLYRVSLVSANFHSLIFIIVMFASEMLAFSLNSIIFNKDFNALESNINSYLFDAFVSKMIYFSIMMIILKLYGKKEGRNEQRGNYIFLFIMPLMSTVVMLFFRYLTYQVELSKKMNVLLVISAIGLLFANVVVFAIYEYSQKNAKELYEFQANKRHKQKQDA